jgi:hypothetical protein
MRRLNLALGAVALVLVMPALSQGQVQAGPYVAFHDEADFGIGAFVSIPVPEIHEDVSFVGDFGYYFPGDRYQVVEWDYWEANADLMLRFPLDDSRFTPWVMGGLNVGHTNSVVDDEGFLEESGSDTEIGLNIGGGLTFGEGSTLPFAGFKFELDGGEGAVIFAGVSFIVGEEG